MKLTVVDDEKFYSIREVCQILEIGRAAVWMAISKKKIDAIRTQYIYLIKGKDILKYKESKYKRKMDPRYYSASQLADLMNCTKQRIYYLTYKNLISRKKIPGLGYRYDMQDLTPDLLSKLINTKYSYERIKQ